MPNPTTGLPEEVKKRIDEEAEEFGYADYENSHYFNNDWEIGYKAGAEAEALRAEELRKEKEDLKRRLDEAMELLMPIFKYGQGNPTFRLGCSITVEVLNRAKLYDQHYEEMKKAFKQIRSWSRDNSLFQLQKIDSIAKAALRQEGGENADR